MSLFVRQEILQAAIDADQRNRPLSNHIRVEAIACAVLRAAYQSGMDSEFKFTREFGIGSMVRKKSGSWWEGRVVGFYSTDQTRDGVCVQLDRPMGPVQIYPASALELVKGIGDG